MKQTISAGQFKARCLKLMDQVHKDGDVFIITKRGKPVAKLIAYEEKTMKKPKSRYGCMKGTLTILGDIISPIDEKWDAESEE